MEKKKILVVDDEARMRKLVRDFLERAGYDVSEAADGIEALSVFRGDTFSLVILDVMMPGMDGYSVCQEIRKLSQIPVMMLTAKGEEENELEGFTCGADEYIAKPFSPKILVARVNAILRRTETTGEESTALSYGGIVLDQSAHTVSVDGNEIVLSYKEFELLEYFMKNKGIALSREKILNNVWNYDYFGDARTIDTHVKKLRSKLGEKGDLIRTIWGMGYKFDPDQQDKA